MTLKVFIHILSKRSLKKTRSSALERTYYHNVLYHLRIGQFTIDK